MSAFVRLFSLLLYFMVSAGILLMSASLTGCSPSRTYDVRGRIVGFSDDAATLFIEHEEIPGYMPAMTMPFSVRDTTGLSKYDVGDAIRFRLVVARRQSYIDRIERLPYDALPVSGASAPDSTSAVEILQPGDTVPPVELIDHNGDTFLLPPSGGQALILTFIYTRCPLPDYCPLMTSRFQALQPQLKQRFGERVHLLSISFDTDYDTPAILKAYALRHTDDLAHWGFATGSKGEIERVSRLFGVLYERNGRWIDHNLATALIDGNGRVAEIWRGNQWTAEEVLEETARLLEASEN